MGAPSDQYIHLIWRPRSLCIFFILYGGLSDHFFAYYIGAPRSLSSLTIWGPSGKFLLIQYGGPSQITFIVYYMPPPLRSVSLHAIGGHLRFIFFHKIYGGPPRSVSPLTIWGPSGYFFCLLYGAPSDQFLHAYFLGASLRSVFSLTIWGPLRSIFRILYGGPL